MRARRRTIRPDCPNLRKELVLPETPRTVPTYVSIPKPPNGERIARAIMIRGVSLRLHVYSEAYTVYCTDHMLSKQCNEESFLWMTRL